MAQRVEATNKREYLGKCSICGVKLYEGDECSYDVFLETYTCAACDELQPDTVH